MGNPIEVYGVAVVVVGMVLFDVSVAQFEGGGNSPFRDGDGSGRRQVEMVPAMFVFGDSLIDNGNNNNLPSFAKANYFPYGIDFNGGPTGRFSNGYTMVDEIGMVWVHFIKLLFFVILHIHFHCIANACSGAARTPINPSLLSSFWTPISAWSQLCICCGRDS